MSEAKLRVLHYDHNPMVRQIVEETLTVWGIETVTTDDAGAVRRAATEGYDLYLLDLTGCDVAGIDLCLELRLAGCKQPMILLSGRALAEQEQRGLEELSAGLLVEPFGPGELIHRVRQTIAEESWQDEG